MQIFYVSHDDGGFIGVWDGSLDQRGVKGVSKDILDFLSSVPQHATTNVVWTSSLVSVDSGEGSLPADRGQAYNLVIERCCGRSDVFLKEALSSPVCGEGL